MAIASTLRMGAEGIKVKLSGRLAGAEIARSEEFKQGRTPLHTFRMDIDYANVFAQTVYGKIGIKVWICKGEVLGKRDLNPNFVSGKNDGQPTKEEMTEEVETEEMIEEVVLEIEETTIVVEEEEETN
jgi:small subunit ribosomal protein S3